MAFSIFSVCVAILLVGLEFSLSLGHDQESFRVAMPGVVPDEDDNYLCTAFKVEELVTNQGGPIYINKFEADSDANKAHHIILQSCKVPGDQVLRPFGNPDMLKSNGHSCDNFKIWESGWPLGKRHQLLTFGTWSGAGLNLGSAKKVPYSL